MQIIRGKIPSAKKVVVYGPEGIGKSTFASQFPEPIFIDTEGSTKDMDVARTPAPSSWAMLMEQVKYFSMHPEQLKTLIIDTADWAETLCTEHVCAKYQKSGIEDFGYGKGYVFLQEEFGRLLNLLTELVEKCHINVVLTAHAKMRKFEQPDEMGAYDRWEMKLSKGVSPMVKEWADMVLFCNYKTFVINVDGQGAQKGKNKVQGGKRVMYTTHHSCWDAKNRYGLPDEVPFAYESIKNIIESETSRETIRADSTASPVVLEPAPPIVSEEKYKKEKPIQEIQEADKPGKIIQPVLSESNSKKDTETISVPPERPPEQAETHKISPYLSNPEHIPKKLRDLMEENNICEWNIQDACTYKGYYPEGTLIENMLPEFVQGVLIGAWPQVLNAIHELQERQSIPFN